ncbi:MAG: ABC transporter substrate-binding protein [Tissierellia bacterium]|nr:ABC transporter substrate-binding protein [Tissierellia bacterium]
MKLKTTLMVSLMLFSLNACSSQNTNTAENTDSASQKIETAMVSKENTSNTSNSTSNNTSQKNETVTITDITGEVEVKRNPEKVVALDNRTFETLSDWQIELKAVPKAIMPKDNPYVSNDEVLDIGNHREPDLEKIVEADPDLVIVGQRFQSYADEIRDLVPNAQVIDLSWDVSEESEDPAKALVDGLKTSTLNLGKIFDKEDEAKKLVDDFDKSIEDAKKAYNSEDTVMSLIVNGGEIGYSAPTYGRVWGPMYGIFGWKPALDVDDSTSDHKGDDVSVEAIAESNPKWIMVLDRDAAVAKDDSAKPAKEVIEESEALSNVDAVKNNNIIYAPSDTYTNESIQTYIELFENIANTMGK